jgi:tRNA-binding protein
MTRISISTGLLRFNKEVIIMKSATFNDFQRIDIRVGRIVEVEDFPEARNPSYKLKIDLGKEIGIKKSSAQLTRSYSKEDLKGRLVLCVVNFPPKQIGPVRSEVLTLGVPGEDGECILIKPDKDVPLGSRLY